MMFKGFNLNTRVSKDKRTITFEILLKHTVNRKVTQSTEDMNMKKWVTCFTNS